jgi:hypothetical protein
MSRFTRMLCVLVTVLVASAAIAITAGGAGAWGGGKAGSTPPQSDTATVYTAITHSAGGFEYAAGNDNDKLFGTAAAVYKIKTGASTKTGIKLLVPYVGLYTSTGELSGTGTAVLAVSGTTETISKGTLDLTKGTGGQKGHTFKGTFTGTGNTKTGLYVFHVKGTYTGT